MNGKIRVSIVATALDGYKPESKRVFNMVSRIHNRNTGYSEGLFSNKTHMENPISSIDGATALKLDQEVEVSEIQNNISASNISTTDVASGLSMENASYIENHDLKPESKKDFINEDLIEETPRLFSDEKLAKVAEGDVSEEKELNNQNLFDDDSKRDEDDFEIPAFLRKQKF